jgi:hypothetical protein
MAERVEFWLGTTKFIVGALPKEATPEICAPIVRGQWDKVVGAIERGEFPFSRSEAKEMLKESLEASVRVSASTGSSEELIRTGLADYWGSSAAEEIRHACAIVFHPESCN